MSRLSRLLSVACLGAAATAACFAADATRSGRAAPSASAESARIIVKLKDAAQALALATRPTRPGARGRRSGSRLHVVLADGRALGPRTQVLTARGCRPTRWRRAWRGGPMSSGPSSTQRRYPNSSRTIPCFPYGLTATTPQCGQWYLRAPNAVDNPDVASAIDAEHAVGHHDGHRRIVIADLDTG
jgi:hypothetical protein